MRQFILAFTLALGLAACAATGSDADEAVRLDGSTIATAERSFIRMMDQRSPDERLELMAAIIKLNMAGVESAIDIVGNPELQEVSVARIRGRVDGMTANEIIELSETASDVTVEVSID